MLNIPLRKTPNQTLSVQLNGQSCQINVYQRFYGVFMDLYSDNVLIVAGVQCQILNRIVRDLYLGFKGDFVFVDLQADIAAGSAPPDYTEFGDRFVLYYLTPEEVIGALAA